MHKLQLFIRILIAATLISGLFYLRLLPRVSRDLWENMTQQQFILTVFIILLILIQINGLLKIVTGNYQMNWATKILVKCVRFLETCFIELYKTFLGILCIIGEKYFNYPFVQFEVIRVFVRGFIKKEFFIWNILFLLSLRFLPKIVFCLALLIDVFIYHRFYYTFLCIPYLLLPLLEKVIIYILDDYFETNFYLADELVETIPIPGSNKFRYRYKTEYAMNPPPFVKDFEDFFYNHYLFLAELKRTLEDYQVITDFFKAVYLDLLLAVLRLITYLYILAYGL